MTDCRATMTWRRVLLVFVAGLSALVLASCAIGSRSTPSAEVDSQPDQPAIATPSIKVALLLPLSAPGSAGKIGQALKQAAELALFDFNNPNVQIISKDTGGKADTAAAVASEAISEGAELIIGPLFAEAVAGAAPEARRANVPMIALSSDRKVAGEGVYLLSFLAGSDVLRVVSYAMSQGRRRFAALIPENEFGSIVQQEFLRALQTTGGELVISQTYPPDANAMLDPVKAVAALAPKGEEPPQFDVLFLPGGADLMPAIAPLLPYFEMNTQAITIIGTNGWDYTGIGREEPLIGGWFPAAEPSGWQDFAKRYAQTYGEAPPRLASLGYDAVSLAITLSQARAGQRYTADRITRTSGFAGVDGLFRFNSSGLSERGLAILQVQKFGTSVIDPAPRAFAGVQF